MPRQQPTRPTSIARLTAWLLLWLMKHAWLLIEGGPRARRELRRAIKGVACLLVIRAAALCAPSLARPSRRPSPRGHRTVAPRLRFATAPIIARIRRRTAGQTLCAAFNAVLFPEKLVARLVKQFKRGYTRLSRMLVARTPAETLVSRAFAFALAFAPAPATADTS